MQERLTDLYAKEDIGMYYCGKRINTKNHIYGPEIRSHYLFVLVDKGKAVMLSHKRLSFGKHDLLVMFPNEKIHYKALEEWSINWLGLYGETVSKYMSLLDITPENPILHISLYNELKAVMDNIFELSKDNSLSAKLSMSGLIYEFFAILVKCSNQKCKTELTSAALKMIDYNFCSDITVEKIAEHLSVDPAYFSRKFKEKMKISPKKYILEKRITRAKELLATTDASIYEISNSVGYDDQFHFYKVFKKYTGISPSQYRAGIEKNDIQPEL